MSEIFTILSISSVDFFKGFAVGLIFGLITFFPFFIFFIRQHKQNSIESIRIINKEKNMLQEINDKENQRLRENNKELQQEIQKLKHEIATLNAVLTAKHFKL